MSALSSVCDPDRAISRAILSRQPQQPHHRGPARGVAYPSFKRIASHFEI
jgi:hypothetical protein